MGTDWITAIAAVAQVILAGVIAAITWKYVVLTRMLVTEARNSTRPRVYIDLEPLEHWDFCIRVMNQGNLAAENIRVGVVRDFAWPGEWDDQLIGTQRWVQEGIPLLTPGTTLMYRLMPNVGFVEQHIGSDDLRAELSLTYASPITGETYSESVTLDLTPAVFQMKRGAQGPLDRIARVMESRDMRDRMFPVVRGEGGVPCPLCLKRVPEGATVCYHCHRDLPKLAAAPDDID